MPSPGGSTRKVKRSGSSSSSSSISSSASSTRSYKSKSPPSPSKYVSHAEKESHLRKTLKKLEERSAIPTEQKDDSNYSEWKYTMLKPGTLLQFRSKYKYYPESLEARGMWLNYSKSQGRPSFLQLPDKPEELDERIPREMIRHFGPYINTIRIKKPMKILHFPVNYKRPHSRRSYTAAYQSIVKKLCVREMKPICADGYTLDFAHKKAAAVEPFPGVPPTKGLREICLLNVIPGETVELVNSEYLAHNVANAESAF